MKKQTSKTKTMTRKPSTSSVEASIEDSSMAKITNTARCIASQATRNSMKTATTVVSMVIRKGSVIARKEITATMEAVEATNKEREEIVIVEEILKGNEAKHTSLKLTMMNNYYILKLKTKTRRKTRKPSICCSTSVQMTTKLFQVLFQHTTSTQ